MLRCGPVEVDEDDVTSSEHRRGERLPGAERAYIESVKLTEYLLNLDHPIGGDKAVYFIGCGFHRDAWRVMESALLAHAKEGEVVKVEEMQYGPIYAVEGPLRTPDGRNPRIRSAWMIGLKDRRPRFVTAYPLRTRRRRGAVNGARGE